ncbi:MAG TPA: hypothetical protein VNV43_02845, partial [Candidatus Acidoferrales bacterium]|nr:hypothetical protein [Candidatus Acidoferrales bacterium]
KKVVRAGYKSGASLERKNFRAKTCTLLVTRFEIFGFYERTREARSMLKIINEINGFIMVAKRN